MAPIVLVTVVVGVHISSALFFAARQGEGDGASRGQELVITLPEELEKETGSRSKAREEAKGEQVPWDRDASLPLFQELAHLLKGNDTQARQVLESFVAKGYPSEIEEELRQLAGALTAYDFNRGMEILVTIAQKGGFSLLEDS